MACDITICSWTPGPFILDHCMVECTTLMPQRDIIQKLVTFKRIVKGQREIDMLVGIDVGFIPNDPMLLFLDNSDSPSIVEQ